MSFIAASAYAGKLADRETMLSQLNSVSLPTPYFAEKYFPLLLPYADSEKVPEDIVLMFTLANFDFNDKVLRGMPMMARVVTNMTLESLIPELIKAILPNNPEEADKAIKLLKEIKEGEKEEIRRDKHENKTSSSSCQQGS